jgi:HEAT repeat protein
VPLAAAITDEYVDVRLAAGQGLADFGDARAVEPLTAALDDERGDVRELASAALEKINARGN